MDPGTCQIVLQDFDKVSPANRSTGMFVRASDEGQLKTRVIAAAMERAGFDTRMIERRLLAETQAARNRTVAGPDRRRQGRTPAPHQATSGGRSQLTSVSAPDRSTSPAQPHITASSRLGFDVIVLGAVVAAAAAITASVVIGGSTPVPLERWHGAAEQRILVLGSDNPQAVDPGFELLRAPTPEPEPRWLLARLHERGIGSLLLEGGPTTNAAFLADRVLDEVFWTLGATLLASDALSMIAPIRGGSPWADDPRRGSLVSVHRNGDELFLRYRFEADG